MEFDLKLKKRLISVFPISIFIIGITLLLLRQFVFFQIRFLGFLWKTPYSIMIRF